MIRRSRGLRLAVGCAVLALIAACDQPAAPAAREPAGALLVEGGDALRKVAAAEKSCVYTGYKRTIHGVEGEGRATRMKVSRSADGRTLLEWQTGDAAPRRWAYQRRFAWMDDPDLFLRNYTVTVDPADGPAVAWRETRHLVVRSVRPGRPALDLYVDREKWVVLREEIRDFDGKLWLTNVFDTIEFRAPDEVAGVVPAETLAETSAGTPGGESLPLAVTAPPAGFVRVSTERQPNGTLREDWTDGLAAFSVLERTAAAPGEREGELQRRSCSGRASVSGVFSGVEVTVEGNLPAADLESVVRALAPAR